MSLLLAFVSILLAAAGDVSFTGTANTADVDQALTIGADAFNLLGNPYTSFTNSASFTGVNANALTESTVWLWDGTAYVAYNMANPIEIAPGQAFFVEAAAAGTATFTAADQNHQ